MTKTNMVFPYTCPFWESPSPYHNECNHRDNNFVFGRVDCGLGRRFCFIMVDLGNPLHPKTADEFMEPLYNMKDVSESELETIRANVEEFYSRMQMGLTDKENRNDE